MVRAPLKSSDDWTMLSHGSKAHDKHRAKSGPQGLWTQSKFVVSELQARLRPSRRPRLHHCSWSSAPTR